VGDGLGQQPPGVLGRAGAEDRPDRGADQLLEVLGTVPKGVTQEMDRASLPWCAEHLGDRLFEAFVGVGDHELDT